MRRHIAESENVAAVTFNAALLDKKREPLLLLHGTCKALDHFDSTKVGSSHNTPSDEGVMFFFTNDVKAATWYAHSACKTHGGEPHLIKVRLHLKNPKVVDFQETGIETLFEDIKSARAFGHNGLITLNCDDGGIIDQFIAFTPDTIEIIGVSKLRAKKTNRNVVLNQTSTATPILNNLTSHFLMDALGIDAQLAASTMAKTLSNEKPKTQALKLAILPAINFS